MKVPNHVLRGIRETERRQSREEFARDIVRAGEESSDAHDRVACDARLIARWEDGEVLSPRPVYRRLLSKVTGRPFEDLGFSSQQKQPPTEHTDAAGADFSASLRMSIDSAASLWGDDIGRRKFLVDAAFTGALFAGPVLRWLTAGEAEDVRSSATGLPVTPSDVAAVRATTETFRRLDNLYGGGHVRSAVVGYLHGEVAPLLKEGRYSESTGRSLLGAAAELTHLAGWMAYDIERHGLAQRYLVQALRFAMAAGDRGFGGEVLAGMSHQAVYLNQPQQAVDLARAARQTADRASIPALVAESAAMEAHALAELGDKRAAVTALDQAERAYDRDTGGDRPPWLRYLDEAYLAAKSANALSTLGDQGAARRFAERSLDMNGDFVRGRMFNTALLARIHAESGEVEQACAVASEAVNLSEDLRSGRSRRYIRELERQLAPHSAVPMVADLQDKIKSLRNTV